MVAVGACCCSCLRCPWHSSLSPSDGAESDSRVAGEGGGGVEYELNDFLLLGDIEETFGANAAAVDRPYSSLVSPGMRPWPRKWKDDDAERGGIGRRRTASLLERINSDLDDDLDGPSGIRDSWTSTFLGGGTGDEEEVDREEEEGKGKGKGKGKGRDCANDDSRDDGSASPNRIGRMEKDEVALGRGRTRISLHHREEYHRRQHSDASSISTHDADKIFKHLIAQCLARNKREGGGGGVFELLLGLMKKLPNPSSNPAIHPRHHLPRPRAVGCRVNFLKLL